jgi:competence protein ComEC
MAGVALVNLNETLGEFCLALAGVTLQLIWPLLEWLGQWHFAIWHQAAPSLWAFAAGLAGTIILLLPAGIPWRWVGILWLLPLLLPVREIPEEGEFWFTLLDVGQGLAAVVHTRNHTLVYDTGARFGDDFNAGSAVVAPYLRQAGVAHIDRLIVSHGDNDHIGGAADLLRAYPDTVVLTSVPLTHAHRSWRHCRAGQHWEWDGIKFLMLNPDDMISGTENNQSCVLRISNGDYSVLLPGDIEKETESRLLRTYRDELPATVLVTPHHGSKTSSTMAFIDAVQPRLVLFPVGYRNRYRFPNQDIMRRYEIRGSRSYDTARDGAVLIRINQSGVAATVWRREARRFWHTIN